MRRAIIILSLMFTAVLCFSDIYDYDFYGFKLNDTMSEVKSALDKKNIKYTLRKEWYPGDEKVLFDILELQIRDKAIDNMNNKVKFSFYNGNLLLLMFSPVIKRDVDALVSDLKKTYSVLELNHLLDKNLGADQYNYYLENILVSFHGISNDYDNTRINAIDIYNINTYKQLNKDQINNGTIPGPVYFSSIDKLPVRLEPSIDSEIIYTLSKTDLLSIDSGSRISDKIDGIKGNWVYASVCLFIYGWVFDADIKPLIAYYRSSTDSLRFRESPTADGKIIRKLNKGEKLELIERGKQETINNVTGNWVKVKTEKDEVGWCFDAYLEEVKE